MLDTLDIAVCVFDDADRAALWNRSFLRIFPEHDGHVCTGEPYSANLRRFYLARLSEADLPHIDRYIADGIARHHAQSAPFEFSHRGMWLRVASLPVPGIGRVRIWAPMPEPGETDRLARAMGAFGEAMPLGAIHDIADGLMVCDPAGRILSVNQNFISIYRLPPHVSAVGQSFAQLLQGLWTGQPGQAYACLALEDSRHFSGAPFEVTLPKDRWVRVSERRRPDASAISTHVDITELRRLQRATMAARQDAETLAVSLREQIAERERAEQALRQALRVEAVGQLTGGVAHDFNNLLSVMMGNVELLADQITDPELLQGLGVIRNAAERGAALMRQLQAFARRQPLVPRAVPLGDLVNEMRPLLASACGQRIDLRIEVPQTLPLAQVDPTQLELVVLNLAINARDAMPPEQDASYEDASPDGAGSITIRGDVVELGTSAEADAPAPGRYVRLSVIDTGLGMTEEVRIRAFEPFFTTKPQGAGSGLGLSQAFGMARQSGGTVTIESIPGQGTSVHVLLPCAPEAAAGMAPSRDPAPDMAAGETPITTPDPAPKPNKTKAHATSVLLVDDDAAVLETFAELLELLGYRVTPALGGKQALAAAESLAAENRAMDILITDVIMPDLRGPDLARRMRETRPGLPVIFISGFADPELVTGFGPLCRVLRKPCRSNDIKVAIAALTASDSRGGS